MSTIYDVARLAGVSPATVSRVLNGGRVSDDKVSAVQDAAKQLHFSPSRTARTLRRRRSDVVALVLPDIENPYFTELARGVEDVTQSEGYSVVLCNTDSDPAKEAQYLRIAMAELMAGVIVAPASAATDLEAVHVAGHPVVAVDRRAGGNVDQVLMSNAEAGRIATTSLLDAGYRRIACITGPEQIETATERADGWREVMRSRQPDLDLRPLLVHSTFQVSGGRRSMEQLLSSPNPPDAVVCGNNLLGVGALQVLTEADLTPPAVGVAVIGSLPFTTLSPRFMTVVRLPARQMGESAARMLLARIAGDQRPPETVVLPAELQPAASGS